MNIKPGNLRIWTAAVLLAHGIGHTGGYWMLRESWLSKSLADGSARWVFTGLWLAAGLGFIASGSGLFARKAWWRRLAVISAVVSLPAILLYYNPSLNLTGALLVDVDLLAGLPRGRWPKPEQLGI